MKAIAQQDMDKLRNEILQNFHHELRTPLTNILMPLELAANNRFSNPEEQSKFIKYRAFECRSFGIACHRSDHVEQYRSWEFEYHQAAH